MVSKTITVVSSQRKVRFLFQLAHSSPKNCVTILIEIVNQNEKILHSESLQLPTNSKNETVRDFLNKFLNKLLISAKYTLGNQHQIIDKNTRLNDLKEINGSGHVRIVLDALGCECFGTDSNLKQQPLIQKWTSIVKKCGGYKIPIFIPFFLASIFIGTYKPKDNDEVCFADVDCFSLGHPWSERPLIFNFVPQSPATICTRFTIFSRTTENGISFYARTSHLGHLSIANFDFKEKLYIIIHGYLDDDTTWMMTLKEVLLSKVDGIVITVDWSMGARMYYPQVVANTRIVAAEIALLLQNLHAKNDLQLQSVQIIGHSLGAHVAGYVGKRLQTIGKITALDPAFPLFEGYHENVRLCQTDADEVEVVHSNTGPLGFGIRDPVGTVDIYLNNAQDQPGCTPMSNLLSGPLIMEKIASMQDEVACSHRRAYEIFIESLRNQSCSFVAFDCESWDDLPRCSCQTDYENTGYILNQFSVKSDKNRTLFMATTGKPPFCDRNISEYCSLRKSQPF